MNIYVELKCHQCGEETTIHETGLNTYDVYPCKECYSEAYDHMDEDE